ncbi:hypothetical protein Tco_1153103 [Tanacetum coccineum]
MHQPQKLTSNQISCNLQDTKQRDSQPITTTHLSQLLEDSDLNRSRRIDKTCRKIWSHCKVLQKLYKTTINNSGNFLQHRNRMWILLQGIRKTNPTGQFRNLREFGHYAKECRKPKRVKDSTYHKEKMLLCKQAEKGVQLQAEQSDWLADTDEEIDEQELEAHYSYMAKIQEVPNADSSTDAEPLEQIEITCAVKRYDQDESNVTPDSPDMCDNDIQDDQNDVECDDERVALANLIANLKLDVDENKKIQSIKKN